MSPTLTVTHTSVGAEVRRRPYEILVDGQHVGTVDMGRTVELPVEPGHHTVQVRSGRMSSAPEDFDAAEGEVVAFRCTGKRFLPVFLLSFAVPSLALRLVRV